VTVNNNAVAEVLCGLFGEVGRRGGREKSVSKKREEGRRMKKTYFFEVQFAL